MIGYLNVNQMADLCGVNRQTFYRWRKLGIVPKADLITGRKQNQSWWLAAPARKWADKQRKSTQGLDND